MKPYLTIEVRNVSKTFLARMGGKSVKTDALLDPRASFDI